MGRIQFLNHIEVFSYRPKTVIALILWLAIIGGGGLWEVLMMAVLSLSVVPKTFQGCSFASGQFDGNIHCPY